MRVQMSNRRYDAILYDLDGTLINSVPVIVDSFIKTYEWMYGECTRTVEDLKSYIGKPLVECFPMHNDQDQKKLVEKYLEINCAALRNDEVEVFPEVMEGIAHLKSLGFKQGIMTSKKTESAMITLELKGMDVLFDGFVFHEDSDKHKPEAEPLILAARKLGVTDMSRVLYVGDAIPDAACAQAAGADFALVAWSDMDKEFILNNYPGVMVSTIKELALL